jgi:hypothetical protein
METTRNELPYKLKRFLDKMKNDLDTQFYYYGSIQRNDYIEGKSDIDISIFTDNETSMITKLSHFLHVPKTDFKKFIKKTTTVVVYGYKVKYKTTETNDKNELIKSEISIYNTRFKNVLMDHYYKTINAPIFILFLLFILKHLYYTFNVISKERYKEAKNYIFDEIYLKIKGGSFSVLD